MSPAQSPSPSNSGRRFIVVAALLAVAWGTFAFGAVYAWAYTPLAAACALIGVVGIAVGHVPLSRTRGLFLGLCGVALLGLLQLLPLPASALAVVSPGTDRFLRAYDLGYPVSAVAGPGGELVQLGAMRAVSISPKATVRALCLLAAFSLFLAGLLRVTSGSVALRLARGIVVIGAILALVGIVQKALLGDGAFLGMRIYGFWQPDFLLTTPFGPFVNKNHFAGWMILTLPLAFGLVMRAFERQAAAMGAGFRRQIIWLAGPEGARTILLMFAALLMMLSLVMTRSRSGLGCLVVMTLVAAVVVGRRVGRRSGWRRKGSVLTMCLVLIVGVALAWAGNDTAIGRLTTEPDSIGLRLKIWRVALAVAKDFPLIGSGLDTFGIAAIAYQPVSDLHFQEAHNDYVQILAEGGIVLAALVVGIILAVARTARDRFRAGADRSDLYWIRVGATIGLVGIALQSAVEFSLQMPGNATLFTVVLALALYSPTLSAARAHASTTQP